jgi:hypothetical protein
MPLLLVPTSGIASAILPKILSLPRWSASRFLRRLGSHDFSGDAPGSFVERATERLSSEIERSRSTSAAQQPAAINARPAEKSFGQARAVTFGKR